MCARRSWDGGRQRAAGGGHARERTHSPPSKYGLPSHIVALIASQRAAGSGHLLDLLPVQVPAVVLVEQRKRLLGVLALRCRCPQRCPRRPPPQRRAGGGGAAAVGAPRAGDAPLHRRAPPPPPIPHDSLRCTTSCLRSSPTRPPRRSPPPTHPAAAQRRVSRRRVCQGLGGRWACGGRSGPGR